MFETTYSSVLEKIEKFEIHDYAKTRNFHNGHVSMLSPYLSRGLITVSFLIDFFSKKGLRYNQIYKFLQELAWREYFQTNWFLRKEDINLDKNQVSKNYNEIPLAIVNHSTGINAIDQAIKNLYEFGYMHNHMRMYVSSIVCNISGSHWLYASKWMYYHLLDADWGSNSQNWQWISGTSRAKKYFANQENINKYFGTSQRNTFLDISYDYLDKVDEPAQLREKSKIELKTNLDYIESDFICLNPNIDTAIYNFYNLDVNWRQEKDYNRILLIDTDFFSKYPISNESLQFFINLSKNISGLKIFVGTFEEMITKHKPKRLFYKEHPTNVNYYGNEDKRESYFTQDTIYPSFFKFWNANQKNIKELFYGSRV